MKTNQFTVLVYDDDDGGVPILAMLPIQYDSEDLAVLNAKALATVHPNVISWRKTVDKNADDYGKSILLFRQGRVPWD